MHSTVQRNESQADSSLTYDYLLQWEWPEHIEMLLRRLIWARLVEMADEPNTSSEELDPSDHLAAKVCWLMAVNPATPSAVLDVIASVSSSAFAERVAENPNTSATTLMRLANHQSHQVRCAVADNPNVPLPVMIKLATDEHADIRYCLAENHNLPELVLQILAEDQNCYVSSRANRTLSRMNPPKPAAMKFRRQQTAPTPLRERMAK
jgi:hypothetical protein